MTTARRRARAARLAGEVDRATIVGGSVEINGHEVPAVMLDGDAALWRDWVAWLAWMAERGWRVCARDRHVPDSGSPESRRRAAAAGWMRQHAPDAPPGSARAWGLIS